MRKRTVVLIGIGLAALCLALICLFGRTYTYEMQVPVSLTDIHSLRVGFNPDEKVIVSTSDCLEITDKQLSGGTLRIVLNSKKPGKEFLRVKDLVTGDMVDHTEVFYVHPVGIIARNTALGDFTGDIVIPLFISAYLALILYALIARFRRNVAVTFYRYHNVTYLAMIIFIAVLALKELLGVFDYTGLSSTVTGIIGSANFFAWLALPFFVIISAYVTATNFLLMRREGRNPRNMLGFILGIVVIIGSLLPWMMGEYLQRLYTTFIDVHNMRRPDMYIEMILENTLSFSIAYLECLLIATVVFAYIAARHVPAFDKDYILILGCKIRDDGGVTKLLQSRADRALAFAEMQREATGKDIIFVPSGGQGSDEVIPEAQAVRNYLIEQGVPEDHILVEDQSVSTYENMRNSMALIRAHSEKPEPKIAFSTTNYHVFRSGMIAAGQGIRAEGIGAPTKRYFWINAFIREFIATLVSERKTHLRVMGIIACALTALVLLLYYSYTH